MKRKKIILFITTACILLVVVMTWQLAFVWSNVFINHSGFITKDKKTYFSPLLSNSLQDSLASLVKKAEQRNSAFWGISEAKYRIIFCVNQSEINKYAGNKQSQTISRYTLLGTFIILGKDGFDLDVISHELCHSFFWSQLDYFDQRKIPTWFAEGVALQLDNRPFLNDSILEKSYVTNYEMLKGIATPDQFYKGSWVRMQRNYIIAKIEIKQFLTSCGTEGIRQIIDCINKGDDFISSYQKTKTTCHGASRLLGEGN